jgi:outer membrane lipoprotein LolB
VWVLLLGGCVSLPQAPTAELTFTGRFALTAVGRAGDGATQNVNLSGRFTLAVTADTAMLDLASPLGTTLARLESSPEGARLQVPDGGSLREIRDADAETLAERVLGFPLPLAGLPWWIRGQPAPDRAAQVAREAGAITRIEQDAWVIQVDERFEGQAAPRRLTLARAASALSPSMNLRVVLDSPGAR